YFFTSQSRRDAEGAQIQQVLATRVAREPALAASRITFDIDVRPRGPVRVTVTGQVPSAAARTIAQHVIQRPAARLDRPVHLGDHLEVVERRASSQPRRETHGYARATRELGLGAPSG